MARVAPLDVWEERRETGKREAETMGGKGKTEGWNSWFGEWIGLD